MSHFLTRRSLSRRAMLRGLGTALALPWLDSMLPAMAAAPAARTRFGALYIPHGATMSRWTPRELQHAEQPRNVSSLRRRPTVPLGCT